MHDIELLPVSDEVREAILRTDANYRKFIQVRCDILEVKDHAVTVRVEQFKNLKGKVLDKKELIEKGKEVFSHLPAGFKLHWRPLEWKGEGIDAVTGDWVQNMLKKHGMTQQQLADDLGVDKFALNKLVRGVYGMTNWHKAAFYWYFSQR